MFVVWINVSNAQIITTIAGTGSSSSGSISDGIPATNARIICCTDYSFFDRNGSYYYSEFSSAGKVRRINSLGIITTFAGGGSLTTEGIPATSYSFNWPTAITSDTLGNMYVADKMHYKVKKIDYLSGRIYTFAGNGMPADSGDGNYATNAALMVEAVVCDKKGNLFATDATHHKIRKINNLGIISTYAGTGIAGFLGDGAAATAAQIKEPGSIIIDNFGNIVFRVRNRIRKIDTNGVISTIAGTGISAFISDGMPATATQMGVLDICTDSIGNIFFSDSNQRVRYFGIDGIVHTIAGTGIPGYNGDNIRSDTAKLSWPISVKTDPCGNLLIGDVFNYRIRKVTFPGTTNATIHISASPSDTVCPGMPVLFDATITLGGATPGYRWYVNGIARDSGSSRFTYIPTAGDSVWCVLTSSSPCAVPSVVSSNVVHIVPRNLGITIAAPPWGIVGTNVAVTATITGSDTGSCNYKWYNRGVYASTTAIPRYNYIKAAGIDTITATLIYNHTDCTDSATSNRVVVRDSVLGIATFTMPAEVEIYPNPAQNTLGVTCTYPIEQLEVLNVVGQQLKNTTPQTKQTEVSIGDLPKGMYLLRINGCIVRRWLKE